MSNPGPDFSQFGSNFSIYLPNTCNFILSGVSVVAFGMKKIIFIDKRAIWWTAKNCLAFGVHVAMVQFLSKPHWQIYSLGEQLCLWNVEAKQKRIHSGNEGHFLVVLHPHGLQLHISGNKLLFDIVLQFLWCLGEGGREVIVKKPTGHYLYSSRLLPFRI